MAAVFFVMGGMAMIWSGVRSEVVYRSIVDSFPPQFQDAYTSRYAFPVYALAPSTPLPLQVEYMKALGAGCVCMLCVAQGFFALPNVPFGCLILVGFLWSIFSTIKSWKIYKENCNRAVNQRDEELP